jgi:anthranilate synthase component 1
MLVDETIVFDHLKQKLILIVNMPSKGDLRLNYAHTVERLEALARTIRNSGTFTRQNEFQHTPPSFTPEIRSNMDKD